MPIKLTKTIIANLPPKPKPYITYDQDVAGLGVRVGASGAKSWTFEYRAGSGRRAPVRRVTIAKVEVFTPDAARRRANELRALIAHGHDPAQERAEERQSATIAELARKYLDEEIYPKRKSRTAELYEMYLRVHVLPAIGGRRARDIGKADIAKLHRGIGRQAAPTANRVLVLISGLYTWAAAAGEIPEGINPTKGMTRFREEGRERFLSSDELARLGEALAEAETVGIPWELDNGANPKSKHTPKQNQRVVFPPYITAAFRLLLFTGCRLREILHLAWSEVRLEHGLIMLPDARSKTGKRAVHLNAAALAVLDSLDRLGPYVIPGQKTDAPRHDLQKPWATIKRRAGIESVRLHDLRHTFASIGAAGGLGLLAVGKLLGHRQASTTAKYAHLDAAPLKRASDAIGAALAGALAGDNGTEAMPTKSPRGAS